MTKKVTLRLVLAGTSLCMLLSSLSAFAAAADVEAKEDRSNPAYGIKKSDLVNRIEGEGLPTAAAVNDLFRKYYGKQISRNAIKNEVRGAAPRTRLNLIEALIDATNGYSSSSDTLAKTSTYPGTYMCVARRISYPADFPKDLTVNEFRVHLVDGKVAGDDRKPMSRTQVARHIRSLYPQNQADIQAYLESYLSAFRGRSKEAIAAYLESMAGKQSWEGGVERRAAEILDALNKFDAAPKLRRNRRNKVSLYWEKNLSRY